jgi:Spy/CpxP family protein refolding chaperone
MKLNYFLVPILALLGLGELRAQSADSTPSQSADSITSPGPGEGHYQHGRHHHAWIWKKLNLTDDQKTKIKSIRQGMKDQTRPALAAVLTAKLKLQQDIDANSEGGTIAGDTSALATAESQFAALRAIEQTKIKQVLNQDQLTTWSDFQKKRQARMQNWIDKLKQPTS